MQIISFILNPEYENEFIKTTHTGSLNSYIKFFGNEILFIGQTDQPTFVHLTDIDPQSFAVKLPVGSLHANFGISPKEISNKVFSFHDLPQSPAKEQILNVVQKEKNLIFKIRTIEKIIGNETPVDSFLKIILREGDDSFSSVEELSDALGYSNRQTQRLILDLTGFSPKKFLNILRFEKCKRMIQQFSRKFDLSSISAESGFFDQSHMIRDFLKFSGVSPKYYKSRMSDLSNTKASPFVRINPTNPNGALHVQIQKNRFQEFLV
ncbi:helix-turn-helix domain-containing protein [Leptospira stimsonii]|uniref:helix-turn-helix domain-containing protein n=1 Tax=Leptospira stimsonii TaxID=2202203 RepID=UPI001313EFFD|nr:helix-turn-helix domain-containing protein [Leptospira stimsonii]